ncbi:hypothetical protein ABK040_007041 [Willaertia magna]
MFKKRLLKFSSLFKQQCLSFQILTNNKQIKYASSNPNYLISNKKQNSYSYNLISLQLKNKDVTIPSTIRTLKLSEYSKWNDEQVLSLLLFAGFSFDQLKHLYFSGFSGLYLQYLVKSLDNSSNFQLLINELREVYPYVPSKSISEILSWISKDFKTLIENESTISVPSVNKLLKSVTPDFIIKARTDPKFDHLRDLEKLKSLIGSNIALPLFEEQNSPTDYNQNSPYILTQQRYNILQQVVERQEIGHVLSGLSGISKSYTMLLLAAYAIVNSIPLIYVPSCVKWVSEYANGGLKLANKFLFDNFLYWNSDLFNNADSIKGEKFDIKTASINSVQFLSNFSDESNPVFFLFDEHNEIFTRQYNTHPYFRDYVTWEGITNGYNTMTVYCGSKFENHLPGGSESKIIRIIPPTSAEFDLMIKEYGFEPNNLIYYATGKIPKELTLLSKFFVDSGLNKITDLTLANIEVFVGLRKDEYQRRLDILIEEMSVDEEDRFLNTLNHLFTVSGCGGRQIFAIGIVYDKGFLYRDSFRNIKMINHSAAQVLWNYYRKSFKNHRNDFKTSVMLSEATKYQSNHYNQICLEQKGEKKEKTVITIKKTHFNYSLLDMYNDLSLDDLSALSYVTFSFPTTAIFVPKDGTNPLFDYVIVDYNNKNCNFYFKKIIESTIDKHSKDLDNLFERCYIVEKGNKATKLTEIEVYDEKFRFSLLELVLNGVIGFKDSKTFEVKCTVKTSETKTLFTRKISQIIEKGYNLQSHIIIGNYSMYWYYIYESAALEPQQPSKIKYSGVCFRNREDIEKTKLYKLKF